MNILKKLFNDEAGVSPIVATLVLVVVAIAGAAAVGTIMGSFSSDVSDSASAGAASSGASTELLITGSTTVQPISELLAEEFMKVNSGIKVTVQAGGSGAGIASTEMDVADIGSASEPVDTVTAHPTLLVHQIGASAVVPISTGLDSTAPVSSAMMLAIYQNTSSTGYITQANLSAITGGILDTTSASNPNVIVYQREESGSGSEDCFAGWLGNKNLIDTTSNAVKKTGNPGVLAAVEAGTDAAPAIGFVDIGFVEDSTVDIIDVAVGTDFDDNNDEALLQLQGESSTFPPKLTRPLNYLTLGEPSAVEQAFISFAIQPAQKGLFSDVGYYSMYDI
ncbi:substrate-binding domain-containing protein [Methanolobus psychrotolerans]|uniref:substrate-binding domain-containing protein n=1 Tax=Methanolobus psychrotolerans TaxID=1874706 RepID=UPI000B9162D1|nr:substrate-binding domain-containing protein [Methanolobus psychrotolerans]